MKAAQRDLKRMFLLTTTIGGYDMPMRRAYIKSDWREIIPVDNTRAIMEIIVDTLEEATGYEILLERKDPEDASSIGQTSEEIILTTLQYDNDMEELNFMTTPYGDFFFTPMQKKRKFAYADGHPIILTDELKEVMCLRHCETVNSAEVSQVLFEVPDGLPYPPLRPEKYPAGSKMEQYAKAYWLAVDAREKIESANGYYDHEELACAEFDDGSGVPQAMVGYKDDLKPWLDQQLKDGEIRSHKFVDVPEEVSDYIEELEEEYEEELEAYTDSLKSSLSSHGLDAIQVVGSNDYVIRPQIF